MAVQIVSQLRTPHFFLVVVRRATADGSDRLRILPAIDQARTCIPLRALLRLLLGTDFGSNNCLRGCSRTTDGMGLFV